MRFFFEPKNIAVIGATPNPNKGGHLILKNLLDGYRGGIFPVNPNYREISGLPCFSHVREIPDSVDLAIVFIPAAQVPAAVDQCAEAGIPGVIVESGGFAEIGNAGKLLQERLHAIAVEKGIRIWGPNCMGLVDAVRGYAFSFRDAKFLNLDFTRGNVSLVVQSGMLSAGFLLDVVSNRMMGINKACSIGNKVDINESDLLDYLVKDEATAVIGLYLESITEPRRFLDVCRKTDKPIVVLKGGKSEKGARAALSHTASLAGNSRIVHGALQQAGIVEADDFRQMIDLCRCLSLYPRPNRGEKVAVLTYSGGAGIVTADFLHKHQLALSDLNTDTRDSLKRLFPDWMPVENPVDLWPAVEKYLGTDTDVFAESAETVLRDPGVDALILHAIASDFGGRLDLKRIASLSRTADKPVFVWVVGNREGAFRLQTDGREAGIPVFLEIGRAVECLAAVMKRKGRSGVFKESRTIAAA